MTDTAKFVTVCRRISFSCGHRYYKPDLDDSENQKLYGSLYSEHGHGHNYVLEAYLIGPIDTRTGMVINLKQVDELLKEVTQPLDHHFLNIDVAHFAKNVPTTENIAEYCYEEVNNRIAGSDIELQKVRLYEGSDLWVDVVNTQF